MSKTTNADLVQTNPKLKFPGSTNTLSQNRFKSSSAKQVEEVQEKENHPVKVIKGKKKVPGQNFITSTGMK